VTLHELEKAMCREAVRRYNQRNLEKVRARNRDRMRRWHHDNKEAASEKARRFRQQNPHYASQRYATDVQFRLRHILRSRLREALKGKFKTGSAIKLLGCSVDELVAHLESLFQPGMNWDNQGVGGWHIDHKKPLALFDLNDPRQVAEACHYTNLQPLWEPDNLSKGTKISG
jgi:DNA-nicking Smr family endonuclease